jgi:hypothetical protein
MTMLQRSPPALSWAGVAGAFALGAAMTWLADWLIGHLRRGPAPVSDDIVLQRVRSRIGELVSRPGDLAVSVENGVVRVAGHVPHEERDLLLTQLLATPGLVRLRSAINS